MNELLTVGKRSTKNKKEPLINAEGRDKSGHDNSNIITKKASVDEDQQIEEEEKKERAQAGAAYDSGLSDLAYLQGFKKTDLDDDSEEEDDDMSDTPPEEQKTVTEKASTTSSKTVTTRSSKDEERTGIIKDDEREDEKMDNKDGREPSLIVEKEPESSSSNIASETGRLFVTNIPFCCTEEEIEEHFSGFGDISSVKIPLDEDTQKSRGFAYVSFVFGENAVSALAALDDSCFQGRFIRVQGAREAPRAADDDTKAGSSIGGTTSSYKKKQKQKLKNQSAAQREQTWNLLYVSANSATNALAKKLNVSKSDLLNRDDSNLAVTVALGETHILQETKQWLEKEGIRVEAFDRHGTSLISAKAFSEETVECRRSRDTLIVKHLPPERVDVDELRERFQRHGVVQRFCMAPSKTLAIVQFGDAAQAQRVFGKEAGARYKHVPLMLEYAPEEVFISNKKEDTTPMKEEKNAAAASGEGGGEKKRSPGKRRRKRPGGRKRPSGIHFC